MRKLLILLIGILLLSMPTASAFCGGEYSWRIALTNQNGDIDTVLINNTYGMDPWGEGPQYIWGPSAANYFCYDPTNSSDYALFFDDVKVFMDIEEGNGTDYGSWPSTLIMGLHLNDCSGTNCPDFSIYSGTATKTAAGNPANASTPCLVSGCQDFSGVNNEGIDVSGDVTDIETGESLTMVVWGRPALPTEAYASMFMKGTANYDMLLKSDESWSFTIWNETNYQIVSSTTASVVTYGNDYFWTASYDASTGNTWLYQNGTDITSTRAPSASARDMTGNVHIGHYYPGTVAFKDYMDEIRIYNVSWTQANNTAFFWNLNGSADYQILGAAEEVSYLSLNQPTNTTYYTDPIDLNWTNTTDIDSVWYSLNGAANITIAGNVQIYPAIGSNSLLLYANDSVPTLFNDSVVFTFTPTVTIFNITQPNNGSYISPPVINITYDYVSGRDCSGLTYSFNGGTNISIGCGNQTIDMSANTTGYYNITLWVENGAGYFNTSTIYFYFVNPLVNCSDAGAVEAVIFSFYDEIGLGSLNGSAEYAITVFDGSYDYVYNLSVTNVTNFTVCTHGGPWTTDMIMQYDSSGYATRFYFFDEAVISDGSTVSISLYLRETSGGNTITVAVQNPYGYPLSDVFVSYQRYYIAEDLYRTVAMHKSDDQGDGSVFLDIDDVWYKFTLGQDGETLRIIGPSLITSTALVLSTATGVIITWEDYDSGIAHSCSYSDVTEYLSCTVSDPTGLAVNACLDVDLYNVMNTTDYAETCASSVSATLLVNMSDAASFNNSAVYSLYVTTSDGIVQLERGSIELGGPPMYGTLGVLLTFMIFLVAAGAGFWNPAVCVGLGVLGIVSMVIMGFFSLPLTALGSLIMVAAIISYRLRT